LLLELLVIRAHHFNIGFEVFGIFHNGLDAPRHPTRTVLRTRRLQELKHQHVQNDGKRHDMKVKVALDAEAMHREILAAKNIRGFLAVLVFVELEDGI